MGERRWESGDGRAEKGERRRESGEDVSQSPFSPLRSPLSALSHECRRMYRKPPTKPTIPAILWSPIRCENDFDVFCPIRNRRSFFNRANILHLLGTT